MHESVALAVANCILSFWASRPFCLKMSEEVAADAVVVVVAAETLDVGGDEY